MTADLSVLRRGNLPYLGKVSTGGNESFVAREYFRESASDSHQIPAIAEINDDFRNHLLGKIERAILPTILDVCILVESVFDGRILRELRTRAEIKLFHLYDLLLLQGRGEAGLLNSEGFQNIAYVRDVEGILWVVLFAWSTNRSGWVLRARPVGNPYPYLVNPVPPRVLSLAVPLLP